MSLAEQWFNNFRNEFEEFDKEENFGNLSEETFDLPEKVKEEIFLREWTALIYCFLKKLSKKQNYYQVAEYPIEEKRRVDFVWFEPKQKEPSILIEHENNPDLKAIIFSEILKFLKMNAKLKILITYDIKIQEQKYSYNGEQIGFKDLGVSFSKIRKGEEFLLIIGNQEKEKMIWSGYSFLNGEFKEIN